MEYLETLFLHVLTVSIGCTAVIVPLLLLVPRMQKRVAARSFYILFLLLAVRLVVPVRLTLPKTMERALAGTMGRTLAGTVGKTIEITIEKTLGINGNAVVSGRVPAALPDGAEAVGQADAGTAPAYGGAGVTALPVLAVLWAVGAAVCLVWSVWSYFAGKRMVLKDATPADGAETKLLWQVQQELNINRPVQLCHSRRTVGPMVVGVLRPVVVLPEKACREKLLFWHELMHIRHQDVAYKLGFFWACAVHWFNPAVWMMRRLAGDNLELCCDDDTMRGQPVRERKRYANMLLDTATVGRAAMPWDYFPASAFSGKRQLEARIENLFSKKKNSALLVCVGLTFALTMGSLLDGGNAMGQGKDVEASRRHYRDCFYENYEEENASVVLADLSGDGKPEMLVLTMQQGAAGQSGMRSLRDTVEADSFTYGELSFYYEKDGRAVRSTGALAVASSHAGWGSCYLVPVEGGSYAVLYFHPYTNALGTELTYELYGLDVSGENSGFALLEQASSFVRDASAMGMGAPAGKEDSGQMQAEELLAKVGAYCASGVPLLDYQDVFAFVNGSRQFRYLDVAPADAFSGAAGMDIPSLLPCVVTNGGEVTFVLPENRF